MSSLHNNLSVLQSLKATSTNLTKHWYTPISNAIADFLTSTLLIIIVMLCFLAGIASHIEAVFDSWFLAVGFQSVVLLTSVNSDLLPKYKQLPLIAVAMSICTCIFVFLSYDGHLSTGIMLAVNVLKSLAIAGVEFIFAYLFVARNNRTKAEQQGYQFDFEGNVVATPYDAKQEQSPQECHHIDTQVNKDDANIHAIEDDNAKLDDSHNLDDNVDTQVIEARKMPAADSTTFKCLCGQSFANKALYDAHVNNCAVAKFMNDMV